jgi:ubiquitin carboxyl-terminal hydrolase 4/11/15
MNPDSEDDAEEKNNSSNEPAGNGLRLDDSSRNGSSSALHVVGAGALQGGGSDEAAGSLVRSGVGAGMVDDELPEYNEDEGYGGGYDDGGLGSYGNYEPVWNFANVGRRGSDAGSDEDVFDDAASNAPNMGSRTGDDLDNRMLEDFGDDVIGQDGTLPGMSTPLEEEPVVDVRLDDEGMGAHPKLD